jgi:biopolymer transport protein ExbD
MSPLKEISEREQKLDMTPMIDVTFLLLIFFLCTIKFKTLEGKLSAFLPKDLGVNSPRVDPSPKIQIGLKVISAGTKLDARGQGPYDPDSGERFTYGPDRKLQYRVDSRTYEDLEQVAQRLRQLQASTAAPTSVSIDPRQGTVYADVVAVLDVVLAAQFENVSFVGAYAK